MTYILICAGEDTKLDVAPSCLKGIPRLFSKQSWVLLLSPTAVAYSPMTNGTNPPVEFQSAWHQQLVN
jgi:hypothetical protein